jgi:hypothetical protein
MKLSEELRTIEGAGKSDKHGWSNKPAHPNTLRALAARGLIERIQLRYGIYKSNPLDLVRLSPAGRQALATEDKT